MSSSRQRDKDGFYPGSAWNPRMSDKAEEDRTIPESITIEFTPAEIMHLVSDRPRGGMIGPRFTGWSKLGVEAQKLLKLMEEQQARAEQNDLNDARYRSEHGI